MVVYLDIAYMYGGFYSEITLDSTNSTVFTADYLNDLWKYNFTSNIWTLLPIPQTSVNPPKMSGHKLVIMDQLILLFGGYYNNAYFNDIWRFNISM